MKCQGCHIRTAESGYNLPILKKEDDYYIVKTGVKYLCSECTYELAEHIEINFNGEKK